MNNLKKGFTPQMMGEENINTILQLIRSQEPVSRTELSEMTGLSKTAVSSSVERLLEADLVLEEIDKSSEGLGRKPIALTLNPEGAYFLILDISDASARMGLVNFANEVIAVKNQEKKESWNELLIQFREAVEDLERWAELETSALNAVTVAVPGVVESGGVVRYVPNIKDINGVNIKGQLSEIVPVPVILENDVNLAALGEYYERSTANTNLVYVSVGEGVGAGIVINGNLYKGSSNHAGEVGWFITNEDQFYDKDSDAKGPLERQISVSSLTQKTEKIISKSEKLQKEPSCELESYKSILEKLKDEESGTEIVEEWLRKVASLLCNIDLLLDPDLIVLGGEVLEIEDKLLDRIRDLVNSRVQRNPKLELPKNRGMASFHGGAALCNTNMEVIE